MCVAFVGINIVNDAATLIYKNIITQIMKHLVITALCTFLMASATQAQYRAVVFNYEKTNFNDGQKLPAETEFNVTGSVNDDVELVEIKVFRAKDSNKLKPLAISEWKKPTTSNKQTFEIPVNYKLRGNGEYDFLIQYYRPLSIDERAYLRGAVYETLDAYVAQSVEVNKNSITLLRAPRQIMADLNTIVSEGLSIYKNRNEINFDGFSDVISTKLEQLDNISLRKGKWQFADANRTEGRAMLANQVISDLQKLTRAEVQQFLNTDLLMISDSKFVNNYPVEDNKNEMAINIGYGTIFTNAKINNLKYAGGPYAGISLPLGNSAFASPLWSNASVSVGLFLNKEMEDQDDIEVGGLILNRPAYAALGYKLLNFLRLNVGTAILTEKELGTSGEFFEELRLKPMVGLSAEINVWLGLGKKN